MMRQTIYFIIDTMGVGGAEIQLLRMITHLKKKNWNVKIVTLKNKNEFKDELDKMRVSYQYLDLSWNLFSSMYRVIQLVLELNKDARNKPILIHSHIVSSNLFSRFLTIFLKNNISLVNTIHSVDEGRAWRYWLYKATRSRVQYVSAMSKSAMDVHKSKRCSHDDRLHLVYNGIDLSMFQYNEEVRNKMRKQFDINNEFIWLAVGNLSHFKNYSNLLDAWRIINNTKRYNSRLFIVGEGIEREMLHSKIQDYGIDNEVRMLGRRNDVQSLMNMADGHVMSSDCEGFPMALLEAAASELPIVATDVGGNSEIVLDGKNGYICPPKNSVALADAIQKMMSQPVETLRIMGKNGRSHVSERFSVESIASQWDEIYRKLLKTS